MNLPFLSKKNLVVGVDIGSHAVKVCQLKEANNGFKVISIGSAVLPEGAVDDGLLAEPDQVGKVIAELFANLKIRTKKVGISISGYSVIVKKINLQAMEDKELEEHILAEAEQYIPFDIEDVYLDFQRITPAEKSEERTDVMLVAAKKEVIDDYLQMLKGIGLEAVLVDVDGFAMENSFELCAADVDNVALVDIGASKMNINIISNGLSVVARDIVVGSRQLTEQIQASLDIEFEDAEAIKLGQEPAGENQQTVEEIYLSTCSQWVLEIKKAIDLYQANDQHPPLQRIVLSGGGAKVVGMCDFLRQETGLQVEVFNPFKNMGADPKKIDTDYLDSIGPEMVIATGIAIRPSVI